MASRSNSVGSVKSPVLPACSPIVKETSSSPPLAIALLCAGGAAPLKCTRLPPCRSTPQRTSTKTSTKTTGVLALPTHETQVETAAEAPSEGTRSAAALVGSAEEKGGESLAVALLAVAVAPPVGRRMRASPCAQHRPLFLERPACCSFTHSFTHSFTYSLSRTRGGFPSECYCVRTQEQR